MKPKCEICRKPLDNGALVIPVLRYNRVLNEKRGDFDRHEAHGYVHLGCVETTRRS